MYAFPLYRQQDRTFCACVNYNVEDPKGKAVCPEHIEPSPWTDAVAPQAAWFPRGQNHGSDLKRQV